MNELSDKCVFDIKVGKQQKCILPGGRPEDCSKRDCPIYANAINYAALVANGSLRIYIN